jgi:DNA-binding XRE family transcriptional regulator
MLMIRVSSSIFSAIQEVMLKMIARKRRAKRISPNFIDRHVGSRLRLRRQTLGITQTKLGEALGVSFQQVQKYEKGTNRLSASGLQQAAHLLQVPVKYFFDGVPNKASEPVQEIRQSSHHA